MTLSDDFAAWATHVNRKIYKAYRMKYILDVLFGRQQQILEMSSQTFVDGDRPFSSFQPLTRESVWEQIESEDMKRI
jgi:hypothetical protein